MQEILSHDSKTMPIRSDVFVTIPTPDSQTFLRKVAACP
jgi:hypothetical protein